MVSTARSSSNRWPRYAASSRPTSSALSGSPSWCCQECAAAPAEVPAASAPAAVPAHAVSDPYAAYKAAVGASFTTAQTGMLARLGSKPEDIATVITRAVTARRPRTRYLINPVAKGVVAAHRLLPGRAYDAVLRRQYGLPR